jgi:hypothetical protein
MENFFFKNLTLILLISLYSANQYPLLNKSIEFTNYSDNFTHFFDLKILRDAKYTKGQPPFGVRYSTVAANVQYC